MENHQYHSEIETDRLILRPTTLQDADFMLKLMNTPDWHKFIGDRNVNSVQDAKEYISLHITSQWEKLGFTNNTVIRKQDGMKLGTCGLFDRPGLDGIDLGFAFLPQFYKKGYAFESASKLIHTAKSEYNISKIGAITMQENLPSQQLLTKLGFNYLKDIQLDHSKEILMYYLLDLT